jgi:hypothetical protein
VRLGLPDFSRLRSAVNSVALTCQTDPDSAHRIVGTGLDREWLRGSNAFECVGRVVIADMKSQFATCRT